MGGAGAQAFAGIKPEGVEVRKARMLGISLLPQGLASC